MNKSAWLTPDATDLAEVTVCKQLVVPLPLLHYVTGALESLAVPDNWEIHGTATELETSQFFCNLLDDFEGVCMPPINFVSGAREQIAFQTYIPTNTRLTIPKTAWNALAVDAVALVLDFTIYARTGQQVYGDLGNSSGALMTRFDVGNAPAIRYLQRIVPVDSGGISYITPSQVYSPVVDFQAWLVGWI